MDELFYLEKIELFKGLMRFNPILIFVDILMILAFFFYWNHSYIKTGWKIDFFNFTFFRVFFIPVLVMYPFNASLLNAPTIGIELYNYGEPWIDFAFLITILGILFVYFGALLSNNNKIYNTINSLVSPILELNKNNISNNICYLFITFIGLVFLIIIIIVQIKEGFLFNPRAFFTANNSIRPIYNLTNIFYPMLVIWTGLRYISSKKRFYMILTIIYCVLGLFLGSRGAILETILVIVMINFYLNYKKIKLLKLSIIGIVVLFFAIFLNFIRNKEGIGNLKEKIKVEFLFGNSFSDTRDFAIVIGKWDKEFLLGKTYLAGLTSLIPRSVSEFRNTWGLGVFTARTCGFDPLVHPGLRPGLFGEAYFNFGIIGVIFVGIIVGLFLKFSDKKIKESILVYNNVYYSYSVYILLGFAFSFCISIGFASFYVSMILLLFMAFVRQIFYGVKKISL